MVIGPSGGQYVHCPISPQIESARTYHDQELCCSFDYVCNLVLISMNKFFKDNEIARAAMQFLVFEQFFNCLLHQIARETMLLG